MKLKTTYLSGPTPHDAVHDTVDGLHAAGAKVLASNAQPACGEKHSGWFLSYDRRSDDPTADFDEVLVLAGDTVYRISYSRPDGAPEDVRTRHSKPASRGAKRRSTSSAANRAVLAPFSEKIAAANCALRVCSSTIFSSTVPAPMSL